MAKKRSGGKKATKPKVTWKAAAAASVGSIGPEWFDEQEYSALSLHGMIFELIDNSLQHRMTTPRKFPLHVVVFIKESAVDRNLIDEIIIEDNAQGIPFDVIPDAFSPYGMAQRYAKDPESLSEHGIGMKTALRGLGENHYIVTKHHKESEYTLITTPDIRDFPTTNPPVLKRTTKFDFTTHKFDHGTQIRIRGLTESSREMGTISGKRRDFEKALNWAIGQRYREFLAQEFFNYMHGRERGITLVRLDKTGKRIGSEQVDPVHPLWGWNPVGRFGRPWFKNWKFESDRKGEWKAKVTFGYGPRDKDDWESLSVDPFIQSHPYAKSDRRLGFDVMRKGIVLQPNFWYEGKGPEEPGIAKGRSNTFMYIRGIIHLSEGFRSKKEKTGVHPDKNWKEFVGKLRDVLKGDLEGGDGNKKDWLGDYVEYRKDPEDDEEEVDEANYRIGMVNHFNEAKPRLESFTGKIAFPPIRTASDHPQDVGTGIPDIIINENETLKKRIVGEVKGPEHTIVGKDVYQLYCYMQDMGIRYGVIIGNGPLGPGAKQAIRNIERQYVTAEKGEPRKLGMKKYLIGFWDPSVKGISSIQDHIIE